MKTGPPAMTAEPPFLLLNPTPDQGKYLLYGGGPTLALAPLIVLEEARLPYELRRVDINKKENFSPDFLALNPMGRVPVLITPEGDTLTETAAIMLYLADRHSLTELAPAVDEAERGPFCSGLFFLTCNLQQPTKMFFYTERYAPPTASKADIADLREQVKEHCHQCWQFIEDRLQRQGPWYLGARYSLVDLHIATLCGFGLEGPDDISSSYPGVRRLFEGVMARPLSGIIFRRELQIGH